jgi:hypothetical protein
MRVKIAGQILLAAVSVAALGGCIVEPVRPGPRPIIVERGPPPPPPERVIIRQY